MSDHANKSNVDDLAHLDHLFMQVGQYRSTEKFIELLEFLGRFPDYVPYNAMLLHIQKPGSQFVADTEQWRELGRTVKPNARPLIILWPFAPVVFVYELEDTEGPELPLHIIQAFQAKGDAPENLFELYDNLLYNLPTEGIRFVEGDFAQNAAGHIEVDLYGEVSMNVRQKNVLILYNMVVNRKQDIPTRIGTIAHELGHLLCGHLPEYTIKTDEKTGQKSEEWSDPPRDLDKSVEEFEAEKVWLI